MPKAETRWIYGDSEFRATLARRGLLDLWALSSRSLGECVTNRRTSWVRRFSDGANSFYVKTYDYPTWRARGRGLGRTTLLARSRPRRELDALKWLKEHGFGGPRVRGVAEARVFGALVRGVLVTEAWPGPDLTELLPRLPGAARDALLEALAEFVRALHLAGFRDRNLDLRNILARPIARGGGYEFVVIDSPRFRVVAAGSTEDALARADRARLARSIAALDLR